MLFPYTTLFRSWRRLSYFGKAEKLNDQYERSPEDSTKTERHYRRRWQHDKTVRTTHGVNCTGSCRSEEHTSELQSRGHLVCRLLLEQKKSTPAIKAYPADA